MLKLLQINSVANWGSTGKIAEQIGAVAIREGWDSYIAYGRDFGQITSASSLIRIGTNYDNKIHFIKSKIFDNQGLSSVNATNKFIKKIIDINPDIIHLHNIHGYYINYKILFLFLKDFGKPVVWTLHDCWAFTGHCAYFDLVDCLKWKTKCRACPNTRNYPSSIFWDNSSFNFKLKKKLFTSIPNLTLVPVSEWLENLVKESFLRDLDVQVIHNGIDVSVFRPIDSDLRHEMGLENKFLILGVASKAFKGRKGFDDFITLANKIPNTFRIIMVGLSDNELLQIPSNIIGLKRTKNQEELAMYYSMADVFINPTYSDNFPTTNLEALACGTPVITYQTGGSPEAIDRNSGIVVEKGNIDDLYKAILMIKNNPLSRLYCRERAYNLFNKDKCFREYIDLYYRILKKHLD